VHKKDSFIGDEARPDFSRPAWLASILRERIVTGAYAPGTRLVEAELQREFDFSNGPVREALQMLVADGLVERTAWRGVRVIALTEVQIVELFQLRLALLSFGAELAAQRASTIDVGEAIALHRAMDETFSDVQAGDLPSFTGRLTQWVMRVAGNARLKDAWDRTMLQSLIVVNAAAKQSSGSRTLPLIHALIDAIVAGDAQRAAERARALTRETLTDLGIDSGI